MIDDGRLAALLLALTVLLAQRGVSEIIPSDRQVVWQGNVGIPGGVPNRTTIYTNLTTGASMSAIQTALNNCPSNQVVYLSAGTYTISGMLTIPSGVTLRGAGMTNTILNMTGTNSQTAVSFGNYVSGDNGTSHDISSGYTQGSTNIILNNNTGISVGTMLEIDETNDTSIPVTIVGGEGDCTWASRNSGTRALGQIVEVTNVNGTTISFQPPLFFTYKSALAPQALSFTVGCQWAGLENLTLYANNTGYAANFRGAGVKYCWVKNVECDFTDGDWGEFYFSFRCEVRDSYFHDGFVHSAGDQDNDLMLCCKTSSCLVENNIFWRGHCSVMLNWGAAGNVIAYNVMTNTYDASSFPIGGASSTTTMMYDIAAHGPHPSFNLIEGNVAPQFRPDGIWGSSSHWSVLRNFFSGRNWIGGPCNSRTGSTAGAYANQYVRAASIDGESTYASMVGNILGCQNTISSNKGVYMIVEPADRQDDNGAYYMYTVGYMTVGTTNAESLDSYNTMLLHGNFDVVTNAQRWDASISDHNIPNSYYLSSKPTWFGALNWPPFDPAGGLASASVTNIPAGYRFVFGTNPPASSSGNQPPVAVASANPLSGAAPLTVNFSSAGSYDPDGVALAYSWTFGDGGTSTAANASHTYLTTGTYSAGLTVSDGVNATSSSNMTINVTLAPATDLHVLGDGP
ncbi:MAG: PKD domain-containing protein [Limisphaerales bacterium]